MLGQPQGRAATDARAAQIAGLVPTAGAAFLFQPCGTGHQVFGRHRQERGGDAIGENQRRDGGQHRVRHGEKTDGHQCGGGEERRDQVPALAGQRGVNNGRPQHFPGLRQQADGYHPGDRRNADASMGQKIDQCDGDIARCRPKRYAEHQEYDGVRDVLRGEPDRVHPVIMSEKPEALGQHRQLLNSQHRAT
jgi:hypothetical protein